MSMTLDPVIEVEPSITEVEEPIIIEEKKPRWKLNWRREHLALGAILLLAAFLGLWNLSINGYSNEYYAAAVKSMLQSWHNFFYVSFDPGGFVTVDKPPVAFWIQAAFAKVFGFSGVSVLLPEALAGVGGVFLLYHLVKRAFGTGAGLVSALILALTPIWVVMNRDNNPDSILVFTLILAAWAMLRGAEKGRLRWLLLAGALVGIAFNVKMLEAYVVLPAFYLMYFLMARTSWPKRILHLALMSVVIVVISFSWAVAVDLTPASERPYVDSSAANSELDLILNYNGLNRVQGNEIGAISGTTPTNPTGGSGSQATSTNGTTTSTTDSSNSFGPPQAGSSADAPGGGPTGGGGFGGEPGITRLLTPQNAGEFNWFMPLALLGLTYLGFQTRFGLPKGEVRSRRLQALLLWGGWFMIYGIVFSLSKGTFHSYYLTIMAPAEAALAGSVLVVLWQRYRQGGWQAWLLPVGLAATAFYQAYLLTGYTSWNQWAGPVLIVVGICAALGLVAGYFFRAQHSGRFLTRGVVWVTMAALLATPAAWSIRAVFTTISGSIVSGTPTGAGGMGGGFGNNNNSSGGIPHTWLTFVGNNLGGQLILVGAAVVLGAVLFGLIYLLRRNRLFNRPALTGILLAFLLVSSSGWWINAAQAQSSQNTSSLSGFQGGNGARMGQDQNTDQKLVQYLLANQDGYEYLVAVPSSNSASSLILATGQPVMSLGGFTGSDKIITSTAQLQQLLANHTVRYFLVGGNMGGGGGQTSVVTQYVQNTCQAVDSSLYSSTTTTSSSSASQTSATGSNSSSNSPGDFSGQQSQQLYVCGG